MDFALRLASILSFLFCVISLTVQILRTFSYGRVRRYSQAKGAPESGVRYAFSKGLMPWEKESASRHPAAYLAGTAYHGGVFAGLSYLACVVARFELPEALLLLLRVFLVLGLLGGTALFLRRVFVPSLRSLSCPDDFASNLIVGAFVFLSLLRTYLPSAETALLASSIMMFLYAPVGKIRHCFFFFYARVLLGRFFGRRGVLPPLNARHPGGPRDA
ncbi:MAG: hypothetical protein V2A71_08630 [Candidatus Eisenbacteria bacterium]